MAQPNNHSTHLSSNPQIKTRRITLSKTQPQHLHPQPVQSPALPPNNHHKTHTFPKAANKHLNHLTHRLTISKRRFGPTEKPQSGKDPPDAPLPLPPQRNLEALYITAHTRRHPTPRNHPGHHPQSPSERTTTQLIVNQLSIINHITN